MNQSLESTLSHLSSFVLLFCPPIRAFVFIKQQNKQKKQVVTQWQRQLVITCYEFKNGFHPLFFIQIM